MSIFGAASSSQAFIWQTPCKTITSYTARAETYTRWNVYYTSKKYLWFLARFKLALGSLTLWQMYSFFCTRIVIGLYCKSVICSTASSDPWARLESLGSIIFLSFPPSKLHIYGYFYIDHFPLSTLFLCIFFSLPVHAVTQRLLSCVSSCSLYWSEEAWRQWGPGSCVCCNIRPVSYSQTHTQTHI